MATRYSGEITVRVLWVDKAQSGPHGGYYKTTVSHGKKNVWSGTVNAPAHLSHGVDSHEEYDDTARAALSFADHDGADVSQYAALDESGWFVSRSKAKRWGAPTPNRSGVQRRPTRRHGYAPTHREASETWFDARDVHSFDQFKAMVRADLVRGRMTTAKRADELLGNRRILAWMKASYAARSTSPSMMAYELAKR